ncbi:MAG TPA: condensation domain-containing protein, partial [Polyangiaceae bacterium]|nr:condensation domain-containing protein [Polyangiaceae bacterium]
PPVPGQPTRELVSSGVPARDIEVAIVDVVSAERLGDRRVGEIWVRGPNVASGYFADPEQTQDTFGGVLGDGEPWLRTGDLGATLDGQLFVTGRLKDLIIVRGRNLYPQDVERTVERACSLVRPGGVVAFSGLNEGLYIIAEVRDPVDGQGTRQSAPFESALDQLVRAVVEEHELAPTRIVLVPARSVRKTSSGKLARRATRADFEQGALQVLAQYPASNLAQCSSPYRQLEHVFRRLDARHTRYQFDLELDVPWAQLDAPGDYYGPEALRGYGYDVDALRASAGAWRLFQWRTALSIATGFEELERALISFTRRESAHFSGVKSVPVLEQEEVKHVALFKRYAEHLAAQRPEHAAHVTEKGSELRRELEAFAHPEIFPSVAAYHYSWWLVILFFEELTIWLYEVLAAEQGIQPAWLAAHRLHAREEAQHVLTDFAFLQSIEASDEERLAWSEQVFQRVAPRLALAMSPEAGLELTLAAYPDLGVRQIRRNPGSPFAALLRNSSFSRTCAAGPYFARVARGDAHPTQDAKPLPSSEDARDLEAWILRWVTENVSLPAGGARVDDVHRDLQAVGLDSVQAVALSGALERHLECRMPLSCVYDHPTAARLARFALARASAGVTAVQSEPEPLLARQRRLLALEVAQPGRVLDHISLLFESSTGDAESWLRALAELVQRQPQLWTQFAGPPSFEPGLCSDLGSPPRLDELPVIVVQRPFNDARLAQRLAELDRTPFILKGAPPWRAELWAQERRTALLLTMHHVCADGWSTEVLFRELDALGAAVPRAVPRIPAVLAAPGLAREQSLLRSAEAVRRLEFARALLKGHPDLERPGRRTRGQVRAAGASLTATQWTMLAELARRHQASPYLVLLTVFHQAWRTHTRRDDLLIQTHLFNRVSEQERQSVAYLVNLLVLRTEIHDGMAFGAALERVRGAWLEATEQELPIDHLVRELFPERYAEPWMPARVAFNMLLPPSESGQVLTWRHELAPTPSFLFFDGMLLGRPRAQGLDLTFWYDGEAFAPEQAEGFMQSFGTRLRSLLEAGVSTQSPARPPEVP